MAAPSAIRIVEVGPRDGLQNESAVLSVSSRVAFIELLAEAGLPSIEVGSFVSPERVPQMADSGHVLAAIHRHPAVSYPVLVPNMKGYALARAAGATDIAVFASASESFSQHNINCSIAQSLERYRSVLASAADDGIRVRGYVSCAQGCPYEGEVRVEQVASVAAALYQAGCEEISLGDTIGVGTPRSARRMIAAVAERVPIGCLAVHFHDTYGQALANILACIELGVATVDSSTGGLGGCPFAKSATGNVATEDLLYMLDGMGIRTGVRMDGVLAAGRFISGVLGRPLNSHVAGVLATKPSPS